MINFLYYCYSWEYLGGGCPYTVSLGPEETLSMRFFLFACPHLFLMYFKVNLRALCRGSLSSCSSKEKNTVMHTIISFDYNNFSIFLKIWIRQNWTNSTVSYGILHLLLFLQDFSSLLFVFQCYSQEPEHWKSMTLI